MTCSMLSAASCLPPSSRSESLPRERRGGRGGEEGGREKRERERDREREGEREREKRTITVSTNDLSRKCMK